MNKKLLVIVEDDRAIRDMLIQIFASDGYAVVAIGDGVSALTTILHIRKSRGPIAAITLDLTLPGKDGTAILRELKGNTRTRQIPVIVISATPTMLSWDTTPMAAAVIQKPFDVTALLDTVSDVLTPLPPATAHLSRCHLPTSC